MKHKIIAVLSLVLIAWSANAQVDYKKPVDGKVYGKKKLLENAPKKVLVEKFELYFKTSTWVAQGNAVDGVGIAGYLLISDSLAQAITNEAYAYFTSQLKSKGYEILIWDVEKAKSTKTYQKEDKKGKAKVHEGELKNHVPKMASKGDSYKLVSANGPIRFSFGKNNPMADYKFKTEMLNGEEVVKWDFHTGFGFLKTRKMATSSMNQVFVEPDLICGNFLGVPALTYVNNKGKFANVLFNSHKLKYKSTEWIGNTEDQKELYGKSVRYTPDPVKYKEACMGMLKVYIDQMLEAYETAKAG